MNYLLYLLLLLAVIPGNMGAPVVDNKNNNNNAIPAHQWSILDQFLPVTSKMQMRLTCKAFSEVFPVDQGKPKPDKAAEDALAVMHQYRRYKHRDVMEDLWVRYLWGKAKKFRGDEIDFVNEHKIRQAVQAAMGEAWTTFGDTYHFALRVKLERWFNLPTMDELRVYTKAKEIRDEASKRMRSHFKNTEGLVSPWTPEFYDKIDMKLDEEVALLLSQDLDAETAHKLRHKFQKFHPTHQHPSVVEAIMSRYSPSVINTIKYLNVLQEARQVIRQENFEESYVTDYYEDIRLAELLEEKLPHVLDETEVLPDITNVIQQARRIVMINIGVEIGCHIGVQRYVDLGGSIPKEAWQRIFKHAIVKEENERVENKMVKILLQHPAISKDAFQFLIEKVAALGLREKWNVVHIFPFLDDPRAIQPVIDQAYESIRSAMGTPPSIIQNSYQRAFGKMPLPVVPEKCDVSSTTPVLEDPCRMSYVGSEDVHVPQTMDQAYEHISLESQTNLEAPTPFSSTTPVLKDPCAVPRTLGQAYEHISLKSQTNLEAQTPSRRRRWLGCFGISK